MKKAIREKINVVGLEKPALNKARLVLGKGGEIKKAA